MDFGALILPFCGTVLGAASVFSITNYSGMVRKAMLGFSSGVMIAASFWSLLAPSIEMSSNHEIAKWFPALVGFLLGMGFLLVLDSLVPHLHAESDKPEGIRAKLSRPVLLTSAVTLHNIPEGMAVGVAIAGAAVGDAGIGTAGAFALCLGMAVQNIPEGAIISMPLCACGMGKFKSFCLGVLSGAVEPIAALLTMFFIYQAQTALPYILSFSAGAMLYVVIEELIPESQSGEHSNVGTVAAAIGFAIMMVLDTELG